MKFTKIVSLTAVTLAFGACATNKSVDQKIAEAQAASSKQIS